MAPINWVTIDQTVKPLSASANSSVDHTCKTSIDQNSIGSDIQTNIDTSRGTELSITMIVDNSGGIDGDAVTLAVATDLSINSTPNSGSQDIKYLGVYATANTTPNSTVMSTSISSAIETTVCSPSALSIAPGTGMLLLTLLPH